MSKKIIIELVHTAEGWITILDSTTNVFIQGSIDEDSIDIMFEDSSNNEPVTYKNSLFFYPVSLCDVHGYGISEFTPSGSLVWDLMHEMMKIISGDMASVLCRALNAPEECYKIDLTELESKWEQDFIDLLKTEKYNQLLPD